MGWKAPDKNRQYIWHKELTETYDWPHNEACLEEKVSRLCSMNAALLYLLVDKGNLTLNQADDIVSGNSDSPREWEDKDNE